MAIAVNATQLKYAVLDETYRQALLNGENPKTPIPRTPAGTIPVQGIRFHSIARKFVDWLVKDVNAMPLIMATCYGKHCMIGLRPAIWRR